MIVAGLNFFHLLFLWDQPTHTCYATGKYFHDPFLNWNFDKYVYDAL